jgi:hypothetical protein
MLDIHKNTRDKHDCHISHLLISCKESLTIRYFRSLLTHIRLFCFTFLSNLRYSENQAMNAVVSVSLCNLEHCADFTLTLLTRLLMWMVKYSKCIFQGFCINSRKSEWRLNIHSIYSTLQSFGVYMNEWTFT